MLTRTHPQVFLEPLRFVLAVAVLVTATASCRSGPVEVVVYTSVDQVFSEPVFRAFTERTTIRVSAVYDTEETKSTGVLNRLIAEAGSPRADVFWSGDPVRPFLLIERALVEPYVSPNAAAIPEPFKSHEGYWTGVAARARVLLVNSTVVGSEPKPRSITDLAERRWRGRAAIANPIFGTTTMHVAALFATWGEAKARAFLNALEENEVRVASSNGEVKRLVVAGEVAFGLTDTDDANEALKANASVEIVYPDQETIGALVMPASVVLMRGGPNPTRGRELVDFLLSAEVESMMAKSAAHMPLRRDVKPSAGVRALSEIQAMRVDYAKLAETMEDIQPWLREWAGL